MLDDGTFADKANLACEELMHALTGIPGFRGGRHQGILDPHPDTSCVRGHLGTVGPFDVAYAHRVYTRQRR